MRKQRRLLQLSLLVSSCFTAVFSLGALAQEAVRSGMWSDSSTWAGGKLPQAGDQVTINEGVNVMLDSSTPELGGVTINGKLGFSDDADLELTTEWVLVFGELEIGTEDSPHTSNATITLTDNVKNEQLMGMGDRGIMLSGGILNLHGNRTNAWTKLAETAEAGSDSITVLSADQWQVGDEIVLASTDFNPRQAETRHITAVSGNAITLDEPLEYMHFGKITHGVDQRGEVGLLTRNIRVRASEDAENTFLGGHIMAMVTSEMHIDGVELHRMGQNLELARYPIHWHLVGDAGEGQYVRNTAIHDTYNRCVTVHGTNYLQVENNVTYNNVGHCFFMEDGIEHSNQFVKNLAIQTRCHTSKPCDPTNLAPFGTTHDGLNFQTDGQNAPDILIPSDNTASSFWITNPNNAYIGNVAAGSDATGFWFAFPEHPTGAFEGSEDSLNTWPRRTPFREFRGNVSHSNFDGFMGDRAPGADGHFRVGGYTALADPSDPNSAQVVDVVEDFTVYKNRNSGIWARGEMHLYKDLKFADNGIGFTHASGSFGQSLYTSRIEDSLFVGESENTGNPESPAEIAYGRSLPFPEMADFPIRAYEFYDYHHELSNVTFVNYEDNDTRKTGAISYLLFTSFGMSTNNTVEGAEFINAKPVYYPPFDNRWSNDDYGNGSWNTSVFQDVDGSVGGVPNSFIMITTEDTAIAIDENCELKPSWNAAVCAGDVGRMTVGVASQAGFGNFSFGGAFGGGGEEAPDPMPIILSRNGKEYNVTQETNIRSGSELTVSTERPALNLNIKEMDAGSWVMFELPGFSTAESGMEQSSLDALRQANSTSYYKGNGSLWVKLVSTGDVMGTGPEQGPGPGDSLQVRR